MKTDKNIEKITKQLLTDLPLESPSPQFVDKVMDQVHKIADAKTIAYQPLISVKAWIIILGLCIGGIIYTLTHPLAFDITIDWLNFSFIENYQLPTLFEGIKLPDFFGITFVFFACVAFIQMFFINKYFRSRNIYGA